MATYEDISPSGGDTGASRNLERRIALVRRHVNLENKRVLDCGCGSGDYLLRFLDFTPHAFGIEYFGHKVEQFKSLNRSAHQVRQGDIEDLPYETSSFDFVFMNEVLEHVRDEAAAMTQVYRVLRPGGDLVLFSPNRLYPFEIHGVRVRKSGRSLPHFLPFIPYIPVKLGSRWFQYNARNYFPWELRRILERADFSIVNHTYVWQTFENISGSSPAVIRALSPFLRATSYLLERVPILTCLGVSQMVVARRP